MPNPAAVGADVDDPAAVGIRSGSGAALTLSCRNSRHCWNPFLEVSAIEADPSRALTSWQHCLAPFGMTWRQPVSPAGGSGLGRQGTGAAWRCVPPFPSSDEAPGRTPGASPSSAGAGGGRTTPPLSAISWRRSDLITPEMFSPQWTTRSPRQVGGHAGLRPRGPNLQGTSTGTSGQFNQGESSCSPLRQRTLSTSSMIACAAARGSGCCVIGRPTTR